MQPTAKLSLHEAIVVMQSASWIDWISLKFLEFAYIKNMDIIQYF